MAERKKKSAAHDAPAQGLEPGKLGRMGDTSSSRLRKAAGALGNEELQKRIDQGNATREQLMQFLAERLKTMRAVQVREVKLSGVDEQRKYWKLVSDSQKTSFQKPDPTRWREPAKIYEEAARALARGSLQRGRQLVEKAVQSEKEAFGGLGQLVKTSDLEQAPDDPAVAQELPGTQVASATDVPPEIEELARRIQLVTEEVPDQPVRRRVRDPWWTEDEEEEEEEDPKP